MKVKVSKIKKWGHKTLHSERLFEFFDKDGKHFEYYTFHKSALDAFDENEIVGRIIRCNVEEKISDTWFIIKKPFVLKARFEKGDVIEKIDGGYESRKLIMNVDGNYECNRLDGRVVGVSTFLPISVVDENYKKVILSVGETDGSQNSSGNHSYGNLDDFSKDKNHTIE